MPTSGIEQAVRKNPADAGLATIPVGTGLPATRAALRRFVANRSRPACRRRTLHVIGRPGRQVMERTMSTEILQHVPNWVWILLAGLVLLGVKQSVTLQLSVRKATLIPVAMAMLSLQGVVSA